MVALSWELKLGLVGFCHLMDPQGARELFHEVPHAAIDWRFSSLLGRPLHTAASNAAARLLQCTQGRAQQSMTKMKTTMSLMQSLLIVCLPHQ